MAIEIKIIIHKKKKTFIYNILSRLDTCYEFYETTPELRMPEDPPLQLYYMQRVHASTCAVHHPATSDWYLKC